MPLLSLTRQDLSAPAGYASELAFVLSVRLVTGGTLEEFAEMTGDVLLMFEAARLSDDEVGARA